MSPRHLPLVRKNGKSIVFYCLTLPLFLFLTVNVSAAASRQVALAGKTLSGGKVQLTCSLASRVAANSRRIQIGRALNSNNYRVIGSTTRRVRRLTARTSLTRSGRYYFICRVTLRNGKVAWSNRLTANVTYPTPRPTARPTVKPTVQPTQRPDLQACPSGYTSEVVSLVNQQRAGNGLPGLSNNSQLRSAAQGHTNWMAQAQNLTHGTTAEMVQRIRNAGYTGNPVGENIANWYASPSAVMNAWMNSSGHRANILKTDYTNIGVGCVIDRNGKYWWTQNFGG